MQPSTVESEDVERIHGTNPDTCERCARDVDRAGSWVRVQRALLRGRPLDGGSGSRPWAPGAAVTLPSADIDSRVLKALLHRAETQSSRLTYLENRGPAVSRPQHELDLAAAEEAETYAWEEFKDYAERGRMGTTALEIARHISSRGW